MAYGNNDLIEKNILQRSKVKIMRMLASSFPFNSVRIWALRQCGFKIGEEVYLGSGFLLTTMNTEGICHLTIEDRVAIAPRVTVVLSSDANWSNIKKYIEPIRGNVILENDCWLGTGSIILPNIKIGAFAVVGAGAVVIKDVPPYHVVAGVPAKTIKILRQK